MLRWIFLISMFILLFIVYHYRNRPKVFFDIDEVQPKLRILTDASNFNMVHDELNTAMESFEWKRWPELHLYPTQDDGTPTWDIIPIYAFGHWVPGMRDRFPNLCNMLDRIGTHKTVLFSRMKGNTTLTPHQGWGVLSNRVIRCHLGM